MAFKYIIFLPLRSKITTISAQNLHRIKSIFTKQLRYYSGKVKQIIIFELLENNSEANENVCINDDRNNSTVLNVKVQTMVNTEEGSNSKVKHTVS